MSDANPFVGLRADTHAAIETLFGRVYSTLDWNDDDEQLIGQWREARGDDAMGPWIWWVGYPDDDCYSEDAKTRDEAIEIGRARYVQDGAFEIIEARMWNDFAKDGDEVCSFAESRCREKILTGEGKANG